MDLPELDLDICNQPDWEDVVRDVAESEVRLDVSGALDSLIEAVEALERSEAEAKSTEFLQDIGILTPPETVEVVDLTRDDEPISISVVGRKRIFEVVDLTED